MAPKNVKPNCFVSYHNRDEKYIAYLKALCKMELITDLQTNDENHRYFHAEDLYLKLRQKMSNSLVTVVLIGAKTGHQKHIDHQIWASLLSRKNNRLEDSTIDFSAKGLLGIYLPDNIHSIPSRFEDNMKSEYAITMHWQDLEHDFARNFEKAFCNQSLNSHKIQNARDLQNKDVKELYGFKKAESKIYQYGI